MDWKNLGLSMAAVYLLLFVSGIIVSLLSTQLQCSKISFTSSLLQGGIFAIWPTIVYGIGAALEFVRKPFSGTLNSFGIPKNISQIVGLGYLVMIMSWVAGVWNIHNSENAVCVSTTAEMTEFKKKMLAELQSKEEEKEANASKK
jgi:hypothetical protein